MLSCLDVMLFLGMIIICFSKMGWLSTPQMTHSSGAKKIFAIFCPKPISLPVRRVKFLSLSFSFMVEKLKDKTIRNLEHLKQAKLLQVWNEIPLNYIHAICYFFEKTTSAGGGLHQRMNYKFNKKRGVINLIIVIRKRNNKR